jgi:ribosomal protein S18 acetylase RimI-like enzyme
VRTVEEILDGHRSQGRHDPRRWWLATDAGQAVGVALVSLTPESGEWDVMYVGVVPAARRRGFGREMMLKVLLEAAADGVPGVTLSVDGRNDPAWHLYRALGFEPFDRREVFLAILR